MAITKFIIRCNFSLKLFWWGYEDSVLLKFQQEISSILLNILYCTFTYKLQILQTAIRLKTKQEGPQKIPLIQVKKFGNTTRSS